MMRAGAPLICDPSPATEEGSKGHHASYPWGWRIASASCRRTWRPDLFGLASPARARPWRIGPAFGDVAGTSWFDAIGQGRTGRRLERRDHLQHALALARAQVVDVYATFVGAVLQRFDVPFGEIHHVDVVAHAGAVDSRVIVTKDGKAVAP